MFSFDCDRYETGRPLKVINFSRLLSLTSGVSTESGEESVVRGIFKDAALMNAIVVFDGIDPRMMEELRGSEHLVLSELLHELEGYNGCVILHFTTTVELAMCVHPLHSRRFTLPSMLTFSFRVGMCTVSIRCSFEGLNVLCSSACLARLNGPLCGSAPFQRKSHERTTSILQNLDENTK